MGKKAGNQIYKDHVGKRYVPLLPGRGEIKEQCKNCIYRTDPRGEYRGCDYILMTGERRPTKAEDCKIGLDPRYQGPRKSLPMDEGDALNSKSYLSER